MTALAVIEQIKALAPDEQAKVVHFLEEVKATRQVHLMTTKVFEESANRVFDRHSELMRKLSR